MSERDEVPLYCAHHKQCRADHDLPEEMLCGFHYHRIWNWCKIFRGMERKVSEIERQRPDESRPRLGEKP